MPRTTGGHREIIEDGVNGFLVPAGDSAAFADRIEKLYRSPGLRKAMGQEGRRTAECFSETRTVKEMAHIYAGYMDKKGEKRMNAGAQPKISVIMGIYNCEETLAESIESILSQSYKNWELIMCDDASTDGTYQIARRYADHYGDRITLIQNKTNQRLAASLNRCLTYATGGLYRQAGR